MTESRKDSPDRLTSFIEPMDLVELADSEPASLPICLVMCEGGAARSKHAVQDLRSAGIDAMYLSHGIGEIAGINPFKRSDYVPYSDEQLDQILKAISRIRIVGVILDNDEYQKYLTLINVIRQFIEYNSGLFFFNNDSEMLARQIGQTLGKEVC